MKFKDESKFAHRHKGFLQSQSNLVCISVPLLLCRYCQLEEPASYRKEQLYNSLKLHEFYHDAEDELSWIKDRRPIAASEELGHNLTEVQNLLHKHQVN